MLNQVRQVFYGFIEVGSKLQLCENDLDVNIDSRTAEFFLTVVSDYDEEVKVPFNDHHFSLYQLMKEVATRLFSGNIRTAVLISQIKSLSNL